MTTIAKRMYVKSKQILHGFAVAVLGFLLVVGTMTTGIVVYHYEQTLIILGDLAEISRAEREAPDAMRAMRK